MNPLSVLMALLSLGLGARALGSGRSRNIPAAKSAGEDLDEDLGADGASSAGDADSSEETGDYTTSDGRPGTPPGSPAPKPTRDVADGGTGTRPSNPAPEPSSADVADDGGTSAPVVSDGTLEVIGGRVTTIKPAGDDVVDVRIVSGVEHGNVTVNPDNTIALVMTLSDFTGKQSFSYEVTNGDGSTTLQEVAMNVVEGPQEKGWATGAGHYMLETDADDHVVVEHGDNHTKVFITGSDKGLSIEDIARIEGVDVSVINGKWLAENGKYGQSEDLALDSEAGLMLWSRVTPRGSKTSNWLLFEKGHDYVGSLFMRDIQGESALQPLYVGAWGEGEKPQIDGSLALSGKNIVVQGLHVTGGVSANGGENVLLDNMMLTLDGFTASSANSITIRGSSFFDIYHDTPDESGHVSGLFSNRTEGILLEKNIFDLNGWMPGVMDPTMFNHNIYLGNLNTDVTVRDTIAMRGSNAGIMVRSGGFIEDNVAIDNNVSIVVLGGYYKEWDHVGNYSLVTDNVVTSAGYHEGAGAGLSTGIANQGYMTTLVDNIVAHLANPDDPDEFFEKYWVLPAVTEKFDVAYDDTIVWNWTGARDLERPKNYDRNFEHLDGGVLDATTIQRFAAELLGEETATIEDLGEFLRNQAMGVTHVEINSQTILDYFQERFGIAPEVRQDPETLRFVPDALGDGVRWDNRLNWSTDDLPGTINGDSVDLAGNHVVFGGNVDIDGMEMGQGAKLMAMNGRLDVAGGITTAGGEGALEIGNSGQVWTEGHSGNGLDISVEAGRFANTGLLKETNLTVEGGQALLATDNAEFDLGAGRTLAIFDAAAKVGFDGEDGGMAILDMHKDATVVFSARSGDLGKIEEFRSGAFGDAPDVKSGIDLGGATLKIDLNDLVETAGSVFTLMDADELVGTLGAWEIAGLGDRDATIFIDYETDLLRLELAQGSGKIGLETIGQESDREAEEDALWLALTKDQPIAEEVPFDEEDYVDAF